MSALALLSAAAALVTAGAWAAALLYFHRAGRSFPELHAGSYLDAEAAAERISLVVAAHDEQETIEACVRSLAEQDYPDLELIVVDDRSSDATPELLAGLARELPGRLRVLTVEQLPDGWGGQSHALHQGVAVSSGEWLCFTDADCRFVSPRALTVAREEARRAGAELLSLLPRMEAPTRWERVTLPLCSFVIVTQLGIARVNDPHHPAAYANGAFLLIRRRAYQALGGHAAVRHLVNDDVALARLAKQQGIPLRVAANLDLCRIRMYPSLPAAWRGWTRNLYGTLRSRGRLLRALLHTAGLFLLPWLGLTASGAALLASGGAPAWGLAAGAWALPVALSHLGLARLFAACGVRPGWSLLYPLGGLFVTAVLTNALGRALRRAGTTWHGFHYADLTQAPPPSS